MRGQEAKRPQVPRRKWNGHDEAIMCIVGPAKLHPAGARAAKLGQPSTTMATHDSVTTSRKVQSDSSESGNSAKVPLEDIAKAPIIAAEGRNTVATAMRVMNTTNEQPVEEEPGCSKVAKKRNPKFRK